MKLLEKLKSLLIAGVLAMLAIPAAAQQNYPSKPIRFIVPYAAGGGVSVVARMVGQKMTDAWGQPVIIDNRPSANGIVGTEAAARSSPDGYTFLVVTGTHVIVPHLLSTSYDAVKDFSPVATIASSEFLLVVHPSVPVTTLQELIALAKAKPGQLNYASSGSGSSGQLATELFNMMVGIKMQHIPYKGIGALITDLVGGQIQLVLSPPLSVMPQVKADKLRAIAVSGDTRLAALPRVPTFTEAGVPGFSVRYWNGVLAPAGMSKAIIDKVSAEVALILRKPEVTEMLSGQGMDPFVSSPDQFAALMKSDAAKFATVIKAANIKSE